MAEIKTNVKSGFFDSQDGDRRYSADDMNMPYKGLLTEGIQTDSFSISAGSGMTISVGTGRALLGGKWISSQEAVAITVPANAGLATRVDSVILRMDNTVDVRSGQIVYRTGDSSAPALVNTNSIQELRLANVSVPISATSISSGNISDKRGSSDCPYVSITDLGVGTAIAEDVTAWLQDNVDPVGSAVVVDSSLTISGAAADAKATGDAINYITEPNAKQLIDENTTIIDGTLSTASDGIQTSTHGKIAIVPVTVPTGVTKITVNRKIVGNRFCVGVSTNVSPDYNEAIVRRVVDNSASYLTIDVDTSIKSLIIYYYLDTVDTDYTYTELFDALIASFGTEPQKSPVPYGFNTLMELQEYVDINLPSKENEYTLVLSSDYIPSTITWTDEGNGSWAETAPGEFTHTPGNSGPIAITLADRSDNYTFLVEFDIQSSTSTGSPDASTAIYPTIGGADPFSLYNGSTGNVHYSVVIKSVNNGKLRFQPCNPSIPSLSSTIFDGTIKNISVKKILSVRVPAYQLKDANGAADVELLQTGTSLYNTFVGNKTGDNVTNGYGNTGFGFNTFKNLASGYWNTAVGDYAHQGLTNGSRNIAIGHQANANCTSGDRNIAIGTFALYRNKGFRNVAVGADCLWYNTTGYENVAIGMSTLHSNTNGNNNVGIGVHALHENTSGSHNTAIGGESLYTAIGDNNVAVGFNAMNHANGNRNICIGVNSDVASGYSDSIAIGYGVQATKANQCVIGTSSQEFVLGDKKIIFNNDGTVSWESLT